MKIDEAEEFGVERLVASAESGTPTALFRDDARVAVFMSVERYEELRTCSGSLHDLVLVFGRMLNDSGKRTDLDEAMKMFGFDRASFQE